MSINIATVLFCSPHIGKAEDLKSGSFQVSNLKYRGKKKENSIILITDNHDHFLVNIKKPYYPSNIFLKWKIIPQKLCDVDSRSGACVWMWCVP